MLMFIESAKGKGGGGIRGGGNSVMKERWGGVEDGGGGGEALHNYVVWGLRSYLGKAGHKTNANGQEADRRTKLPFGTLRLHIIIF